MGRRHPRMKCRILQQQIPGPKTRLLTTDHIRTVRAKSLMLTDPQPTPCLTVQEIPSGHQANSMDRMIRAIGLMQDSCP